MVITLLPVGDFIFHGFSILIEIYAPGLKGFCSHYLLPFIFGHVPIRQKEKECCKLLEISKFRNLHGQFTGRTKKG